MSSEHRWRDQDIRPDCFICGEPAGRRKDTHRNTPWMKTCGRSACIVEAKTNGWKYTEGVDLEKMAANAAHSKRLDAAQRLRGGFVHERR